jgi:hypothetical protein
VPSCRELAQKDYKYCLLHADKKLSDRWATRFGLREFTARDGKSYLNKNPIYLKATFSEEKKQPWLCRGHWCHLSR